MHKVYLSVDLEGINGVINEQQTLPTGGIFYENTLVQLHQELNSIIEGLKEEGIEYITVNDAHNTMDNISLSKLPNDVELFGGKPRDISMMYGLDESYDCIFFIGYHSKAGHERGVLSHTFNFKFKSVKLNGKPVSEAQLNSIYAGQIGVPIAFASGDNFFCEEIKNDIGDITTVITKQAVSFNSARFRKNEELFEELKIKTQKTLKNKNKHILYNIPAPYILEINLGNKQYISKFSYLTNAKVKGTKITFKSNNFAEAYKFLQFISVNT